MYSRLLLLSALSAVLACPEHDINLHKNNKRETAVKDWTYEASYNWGMINPNYTVCQTGTQQSPIQLLLTQGLSLNHILETNYPTKTSGELYNWGYGPAFVVSDPDITTHPSIKFDNQTAYLKGWHIHSPADHSVQGDRTKSELHLVHGDSTGKEVAVLAIRIDPGNGDSPFFTQFDSVPAFDSHTSTPMVANLLKLLEEANMFDEFWTYQGSLTSPPCREGIRWFVARHVLFVSVEQMRAILKVSTYSARVEQEVWHHQINA